MADSADVKSTDVIRAFAAATVKFQEEARLCLAMLDSQLRQVSQWLEQDRPGFWKHEIERCMRDVSETRVRLHQCRMRRTGDFRPSCVEEVKAHEHARQSLDYARRQVPVVRHWIQEVTHESSEFRGRAGRLQQFVERDVPQLLAMLRFSLEKLEEYGELTPPPASRMSELKSETNSGSGIAADTDQTEESRTDAPTNQQTEHPGDTAMPEEEA